MRDSIFSTFLQHILQLSNLIKERFHYNRIVAVEVAILALKAIFFVEIVEIFGARFGEFGLQDKLPSHQTQQLPHLIFIPAHEPNQFLL